MQHTFSCRLTTVTMCACCADTLTSMATHAVLKTGLGEVAESCYIISGTTNRGDGIVLCDKQQAFNTPGYEVGVSAP